MRPTVSIVLWVALALGACSKTEPAPDPVRAVRTMTVGLDAAGGSCEYGHRSQRDGVDYENALALLQICHKADAETS